MTTRAAETIDVVEWAHKAREELSRLTPEEKRKYLRAIRRAEKLLDQGKIEEAAQIIIQSR